MKASVVFFCLTWLAGTLLYAQKPVSECTVVYELSVSDSKADPEFIKSMAGTTKTVYIKGGRTRSDLQSPSFLQSTFTDSKSDTTIILRELGNAKYLSYLTGDKLKQQNQKYDRIIFNPTPETKVILGYECKKVEAKLTDGSVYNIYYSPSIIPFNREYEYQFKDLPGFALEYETQAEDGKATIRYSAVKLSLTPVQSARFDIPKSGYRIL